MFLPTHQKGIVQLGIIGVLLLFGAVAVGTKLVSNSDLTFFNIAEKAAGKVKKTESKNKKVSEPKATPKNVGINAKAGVKKVEKRVGESCTRDAECKKGFACLSKKCIQRCDLTTGCDEGYYCYGRLCRTKLSLGQKCIFHTECFSGRCGGNGCEAFQSGSIESGQSCAQDSDCKSNECKQELNLGLYVSLGMLIYNHTCK